MMEQFSAAAHHLAQPLSKRGFCTRAPQCGHLRLWSSLKYSIAAPHLGHSMSKMSSAVQLMRSCPGHLPMFLAPPHRLGQPALPGQGIPRTDVYQSPRRRIALGPDAPPAANEEHR